MGFMTRTLAAEPKSPRALIAERLEEARPKLQEAKEIAKDASEGELYVWLNSEISQIDAMRSELAEEEGS